MMMSVTPLYAGILTLVFLALSVAVIRQRFAVRTSLGDAGDKALIKRMRVQANFAEYVPLALVLMLCAELAGAPAAALHVMGLTLLAGRICHAIGMSLTPQIFILRQLGILATFTMLGASALALIVHTLL